MGRRSPRSRAAPGRVRARRLPPAASMRRTGRVKRQAGWEQARGVGAALPGFHPHWVCAQWGALCSLGSGSRRRCYLCVGLAPTGDSRRGGPAAGTQSPRTRSGLLPSPLAGFSLQASLLPFFLFPENRNAMRPQAASVCCPYAVCGWPAGKGTKSSSRRHNTCSSTASLRATATTARRLARLPPCASRKPQRRSALSTPWRLRI